MSHQDNRKYRTILMDPPWPYKDKTLRFGEKRRAGASSAESQYPTLSIEQLKLLQIPAEDNAYLFLWVTNPFLREGLDLTKAWGFTYKTLLTWLKPSIRLGYYFRSRTEHIIFATKGKPGRLKRNDLGNVIEAPVLWHSKKPDFIYSLIEKAVDGPFLELFARQKTKGWDVWGNEVESDIEL